MKTDAKRFQEVIAAFPKFESILRQLNDANIPYAIGGSVTLYVQGNDRRPNDVDIIFTDEAFDRANELFGLEPQHIERPYNSMNKSTPVDDGSVDFLNQYVAKAENRSYYSPPTETVSVIFDGMKVTLSPAEKMAVFKLITRREHHNDLGDFNELFQHPDFDMNIFWQIVDSLDAREVVTNLLKRDTSGDETIQTGNAAIDSDKGWFVGGSLAESLGIRHTYDVELKWSTHAAGEERADWVTSEVRTTVAILISGTYEVMFRNKSAVLANQGDFVMWGRGSDHKGKAVEDSVILTVRWPSIPKS